MSQPPSPYSRQYNFTNFQTTSPTTPLPGQKVDQELNAVLTALNDTISRLGEVQADDGKIRNSALNLTTIAEATASSISASAISSINAAGSSQISAVNGAGTTQVSAVNAAGSAQLAALNAVINSANSLAAQNAAYTATQQAENAQNYANLASTFADQSYNWRLQAQDDASAAGGAASEAIVAANAAANHASSASSSASLAGNEALAAANASNDAESSKMAALDAKAQAEAAADQAQSIVDNGSAQIIANVQPFIDAAAASATAASGSASAASTSANNASNSASNAAASAINASSSASSAAGSVTAASASATAAGTSASNAASSANAAASSASLALGSANSASGSAVSANSSATAAEGHKNAANAFAVTAQTFKNDAEAASVAASNYADAAADSATAADASAAAAAGSASDASAQASAASSSASAAAASAASFSLSIGTVSSGATAEATITGTAPAYTLNLTLQPGPAGNDGNAGAAGPAGPMGQSLNFVGPWASLTSYLAGDVVVDGGQAYAAIYAVSSSTNPSSDPTNWVLVSIVGPQGPAGTNGTNGADGADGADGTSLSVFGAWVVNLVYNPGQIVVAPSNGLPYLCLSTTYSTVDPQFDPTYWVQLNIATSTKSVTSTGTVGSFTETVNVSDVSGGVAGEIGVTSTQYTHGVKLTAAGVQFNNGSVQSVAFNPALWADLVSPAFTGEPTVPALATSDNSLKIANTGYVKAQGYATLSGSTFTGKIVAATPSSASAGINVGQGSAPSSPVNGDLWVTSAGALQFRGFGVTRQAVTSSQSTTYDAAVKQSFQHSASGAGIRVLAASSNVTTPVAGDIWANSTFAVNQIIGNMNSMNSAMSAVRAYSQVSVASGTPTLAANFNVSSLTDNAVGDFTLNFTGAMVDTNFGVVGSTSGNAGNNGSVVVTARAVGTVRVNTIWNGALADVANFTVLVIR